jgi:hypothetical protein
VDVDHVLKVHLLVVGIPVMGKSEYTLPLLTEVGSVHE